MILSIYNLSTPKHTSDHRNFCSSKTLVLPDIYLQQFYSSFIADLANSNAAKVKTAAIER